MLFSSRILTVNSADEFYTLMGDLTQEMLQGNILDPDSMIKVCNSCVDLIGGSIPGFCRPFHLIHISLS